MLSRIYLALAMGFLVTNNMYSRVDMQTLASHHKPNPNL